jgi:hypothetical protein
MLGLPIYVDLPPNELRANFRRLVVPHNVSAPMAGELYRKLMNGEYAAPRVLFGRAAGADNQVYWKLDHFVTLFKKSC